MSSEFNGCRGRAFRREWEPPHWDLDGRTEYGWQVLGQHRPDTFRFEVGYGTDIGAGTVVAAHHGVTLGRFVQVGPHCTLLSLDTIDGTHGEVVVGDGAKLGAYTLVLPGSHVPAEVFVPAYSIVKPAGWQHRHGAFHEW